MFCSRLLEHPCTPRDKTDVLSISNVTALWSWFQKLITLCFPKEIICLFLGKAQNFYSSFLFPSQFSSSVTWLAQYLSTYLRLLYLHLFQKESRKQIKALQRKSENKSLQLFSTTFILPILAEDVLFRVSKPFKPTQVLKNICFPLYLIDQINLSVLLPAGSLLKKISPFTWALIKKLISWIQ